MTTHIAIKNLYLKGGIWAKVTTTLTTIKNLSHEGDVREKTKATPIANLKIFSLKKLAI